MQLRYYERFLLISFITVGLLSYYAITGAFCDFNYHCSLVTLLHYYVIMGAFCGFQFG